MITMLQCGPKNEPPASNLGVHAYAHNNGPLHTHHPLKQLLNERLFCTDFYSKTSGGCITHKFIGRVVYIPSSIKLLLLYMMCMT